MTGVLLVGAGPVGLTLAAELARHGIKPRLVEKRTEASPWCRAIGVTPRTLEVWEDMGVVRPMIDAGLWLTGMRTIVAGGPQFDQAENFPMLPYEELGLPQYETERILERHLRGLGATVERGVELASLLQDAQGVEARLRHVDGSEETLRCGYVIGCDGAHSTVRRQMDIAFEGDAFPMMFMLGDVHIEWDLPRGYALRALRLHEDAAPDMFIAIPLPEEKRYRVSMLAPGDLSADAASSSDHGIQSERPGPELHHIQAIADDLLPEKPTLSDLRWSSTFRISMRLAETYRRGRVFLAGDAAHIHPPTGGQGMNTGIQDAYNLAWKLALVLRGVAPASLLDSYEAERRPVGQEVIERTIAASISYGREKPQQEDPLVNTQVLVSYPDSPLARDDAPTLADRVPRPGDRAPDAAGLRRARQNFPIRWFEVLRGTEHVLLLHAPDNAGDLRAQAEAAAALAADCSLPLRVVVVTGVGSYLPEYPGYASYQDAAGTFTKAYGAQASAFLIRPDGHLAWRGPSADHPGLAQFLKERLSVLDGSGPLI